MLAMPLNSISMHAFLKHLLTKKSEKINQTERQHILMNQFAYQFFKSIAIRPRFLDNCQIDVRQCVYGHL